MLSTTDPRLSKIKTATPTDVSLPSSTLPPLEAAPFDVSLRQALLRSGKSARARAIVSRPPEAKPDRPAQAATANLRRSATLSPTSRHDPALKKAHSLPVPSQAKRARDKAPASELPAPDAGQNRVGNGVAAASPDGVTPVALPAPVRPDVDVLPAASGDVATSDSEAQATVVIPFPFPYPPRGGECEPDAGEQSTMQPVESDLAAAVIVPLFANAPAPSRGPVSGTDLVEQPRPLPDDGKIIPLPMAPSFLHDVKAEMERGEPGSEASGVVARTGQTDFPGDHSKLAGEATAPSEAGPVRNGLRSLESPAAERETGDLRIDNVIQLFAGTEEGRDLPRNRDGTGGAKSSMQMKNAEGTSRAGKLGEQTLPSSDPKLSLTADNAPSPARVDNSRDAISADRLSATLGASAVNRVESGRTEGAAAPAEVRSPTNVEQIQQKLVNCAVELKRFKADSMSVVLKPDAHTEVYLHLTLNQGSVDVETQLKRGDLAALQGQWGQMQEALSRQGVRVGPLQGADAQSFANLDSGGSPGRSGREEHSSGEPQPERPSQPIFVSTQSAARPSISRPSRPDDRSWESWA